MLSENGPEKLLLEIARRVEILKFQLCKNRGRIVDFRGQPHPRVCPLALVTSV